MVIENLIKIQELTPKQIASICDHTFLKRPEEYKYIVKSGNPILAREADFQKFLEDMVNSENQPYAVCVRPEDVKKTSDFLKSHDSKIIIASVVGFPYGDNTRFKCNETINAIKDGAKEIDMVLDYTRFKQGDLSYVTEDVKSVVKRAHHRGASVKLILEICELSAPEIFRACTIADIAECDFVKTSTGYGAHGATSEALRIMRDNFYKGVKMSGGVKKENLKELLYAASGRNEGYFGSIDLNPMKIRIGESSLLKDI